MKVTYDPKSDAMYIYLSPKKSTRTEEAGENMLVDYAGTELVSIELLDASKRISKDNLQNYLPKVATN